MSPRLAFAIETAIRAGKSTLGHFQVATDVVLKADETPVTIADRNAERIARECIGKSFPGEHVFGEEEGGDKSRPHRWVVDPIDGTKSFVSGVPLYATLISFEQDFVPVVGVAYFPALNELLYAEAGCGAFFNGVQAHVSRRNTLANAVVSCGGLRSMIRQKRWDGFAAISESAMATRSWSDAYGHALVATGRVEAMIDPIVSRWDLSAVDLIVREAGGQFTDFKGKPALNDQDNLEAISSNGLVHQEVLEAFQT